MTIDISSGVRLPESPLDSGEKMRVRVRRLRQFACLILAAALIGFVAYKSTSLWKRYTALEGLLRSGAEVTEGESAHGSFSLRDRIGRTAYRNHLMALGNINGVGFHDQSIADEDLRQLALFPEINAIDLKFCRTSDSSLQWLSKLTQLKILVIWHDSITDAGLEHLQTLTELRQVDLSGNGGITGSGFRNWTCADTLIDLNLINTGITVEGLQELRRFKKLRWLQLGSDDLLDSEDTEVWEVLLELPELQEVSGLPDIAFEVLARHPNFAARFPKEAAETGDAARPDTDAQAPSR